MASIKEKRKQYALVQAPKAAKPGFFSRCRLWLKIEAINLPKKPYNILSQPRSLKRLNGLKAKRTKLWENM